MKKNKVAKKQNNRGVKGVLFLPAGVLTGMGVGFAMNNLLPGLFVGLGIGFALWALSVLFLD